MPRRAAQSKPTRPTADTARGTANARGYGRQWRARRLAFLKRHPLCIYCKADGIIEPATVVDHRTPHRGNPLLFWDEANWDPLCKRHHDQKTAKGQ